MFWIMSGSFLSPHLGLSITLVVVNLGSRMFVAPNCISLQNPTFLPLLEADEWFVLFGFATVFLLLNVSSNGGS